jgi:predicted small lipoprotein YifL
MRLLLLSIILCLTVAACGSKGPLYLPEKQYPQGNP